LNEATLAQGFLRANGMHAFLPCENATAAAHAELRPTVALQVPQAEAEAASELLKTLERRCES
jgi:hypothetical protein